MQKMKKISLLLATVMTCSLMATACEGLPSFPFLDNSETSTQIESSLEDSSIATDFSKEESSYEESSSEEESSIT